MWAEWSYNTFIHSATGMSPYEITFGKKPPSIPLCLIGDSNVAAVDEWLTKCDALFSILTKKLSKAQQRMKANADKHQRDVQFEVRDQVLVKLRSPRHCRSIL